MYIVGHYVITELSGVFGRDLYDSKSLALMLPDYVRCHDWGYDRCFAESPRSYDGQLVRAHMLADWYVHYGDGVEREKRGWAYRKMHAFASRYEAFFDLAKQQEIFPLDGEPPDSRRGFAHTMVEYAIDTWLADQSSFGENLARLQHAMVQLGTDGPGVGGAAWIADVMNREGIETSSQDWRSDVQSFRERAIRATKAAELSYRAGVKKFGLTDSQRSVDHVGRFIKEGLSEIQDEEMQGVVAATAAFIGKHMSLAGGQQWT